VVARRLASVLAGQRDNAHDSPVAGPLPRAGAFRYRVLRHKKWIGNGTIVDVVVVLAQTLRCQAITH
jgi:hypothetical protein